MHHVVYIHSIIMKQILSYFTVFSFVILTTFVHTSHAVDTLSFQWPYHPFHGSHYITGAFAEYRTTSPSHHFHDGVDIRIPDNDPVYPSLNGVVHSIGTVGDHGGGAWVRVRTEVNGMYKHISYVHIAPNPSLSVGDEVEAGETILGTIIPGWGHVHFRERELVTNPDASGADINAIRPGGGLTPYIDDRAPVIAVGTLEFRDTETSSRLAPARLHGNVEIIVRAHGQYGPEPIHQRRGIYKLGYHIMSKDTASYVYSPPDEGIRFQFDRKPINSHVNRVFVRDYSTNRLHYYYVTGGNGASAINETLLVPQNSLRTGDLPNGEYILKIFAEDTRENADTIYAPISINQQPAAPVVQAVTVDDNGSISISWLLNAEDNLGGYRLYYDHPSGWELAVSETLLTAETTSFTIENPSSFFNTDESYNLTDVTLHLTAVNDLDDPIESSPSIDFYAKNASWSSTDFIDHYSVLIVDGILEGEEQFAWEEEIHPFITKYGNSLPFEAIVSSARESSVMDSTVFLPEYDVVLWYIGTRGFQNTSFDESAQRFIREYLESGGKLIVSGSAIGVDLGRPDSENEIADSLFYADYFRAAHIAHAVAGADPKVHGITGTRFENFSGQYNDFYTVSWTDDIQPLGGAETILIYQRQRPDGSHRGAAIGYTGPFGESTIDGGVVYFAFPVETIEEKSELWELLVATFQYFDFVTSIDDSPVVCNVPDEFTISGNYPNPFNMATNIDVGIPRRSNVTLKIYDVLGRKVAILMDGDTEQGSYTVIFDATGLASGAYYARLKSGDMIKTQSMILLK